MVNVQTGNMLDVVVEGKSLGLKQRDSDHRKYDVIWLPEPENLALILLAELKRLNGAESPEQRDTGVSVGERIIAEYAVTGYEGICSLTVVEEGLAAAIDAAISAAVEAERKRCAEIAERWANSHSCDAHDNDPCCHVRTGSAITAAIRKSESREDGG